MTHTTTIQALLIDPFTRRVQNITLPAEGLREYYKAISTPDNPVHLVEIVYPSKPDMLILIDEEGLLLNPDFQEFFLWEGQFLAGKAIIVGDDGEGGFADCPIDQLDIAKNEWLGFPPHDHAVKYAQTVLDRGSIITAF